MKPNPREQSSQLITRNVMSALVIFGLITAACGSSQVVATNTATGNSSGTPISALPLPPGISPENLISIPLDQSAQLVIDGTDLISSMDCQLPNIQLYRIPKTYIAPGVVREAFVLPNKDPNHPVIVALLNHENMPPQTALDQDLLDMGHELIHLCEPKDGKKADRSKSLLNYKDLTAGITITIIPSTRYVNPGLTTEIQMTDSKGNQENYTGGGSLEELFTYAALDYLIDMKGKNDLLQHLRADNPLQPAIYFVRNSLKSTSQMQEMFKAMQTDDPKTAFDLLYGAMLRKGLNVH